ncbi:transmembrane glucosamine N-acetyltransferase NagX [Microbulbifer taiwanensis]|uniref:Transmembrane glucosamine N-acetyltransferase NagX n=1 Tax=Microbulbifer taiwanensis TaxID=986746 RepID=A0ABW1YQH5_9GAMM|nr:heparan-alpha-glucosaminide N-acetyltransferase domain-containing protein [Microbulbifer taiwanensis]
MTNKKQRLASVDALRGFDMFWIIGGEALFAPLLALTGWSLFAFGHEQMQHSQWHGFRFYDLIFPLFIFLSGVTLGIANKSLQGLPLENRWPVYRKAIKRLLILIGLGIVYNHGWGSGIPADLSEIRYASVLARIGFAWFFAAMIVWHFGPRAQYAIAAAILLGYWLLQVGFGPLTPADSVNSWLDQCCLPGITYLNRPYDPEGLLSTLPSIVNALVGVFAGRWLRQKAGQHTNILVGLAAGGLACLLVGLLWHRVYPINKELWTGSFVLITSACSLLLLALFYLLVDRWQWRYFNYFFAVIGCNAILVYLGTSLVNWQYSSNSLFGGIAAALPDAAGTLVIACGVLLLQWLVLRWLYRREIFISP